MRAENKALKELLHKQGSAKSAKVPKFTENYSVDKNKGKQKSKRGKQATGHRAQESKLELVVGHVDVYEQGVAKSRCVIC